MTSTILLNDGTSIPQLGFGTYLIDPDDTAETVGHALEAGYRHIDTAQMYGNEAGVGAAIAASGLERDALYVTSKIANDNHRPVDVRRSFDETLDKLQLERLDLLLMHWPLPTLYDGDYVSTWQAMAALRDDGRLTSVGVSNFEPNHLRRIITETAIVPVVNQIEVHPYFPNEAARAASLEYDVRTEAWGPLGQGAVLEDPTLTQLAAALGKSVAQVVLRWHIQRGDIVFPKSSSKQRMAANLTVFDFELSAEQMATIDDLDRGPDGRVGPDPATFDYLSG